MRAESRTLRLTTCAADSPVGTAFTFGSAAAASAPAIVGWIATSYSIAAALPLLALSFFLLVPMFLFVARETTRKELADFVGQRT
jgi:fucose permease